MRGPELVIYAGGTIKRAAIARQLPTQYPKCGKRGAANIQTRCRDPGRGPNPGDGGQSTPDTRATISWH
jgi:hypothetical protein